MGRGAAADGMRLALGDLSLELRLKCVNGLDAVREASLFDEHDGDAVANGIGKAADLGYEEVAFLPEPAQGERAAQDIEEFGVDGIGGVLQRHSCVPQAG